MDPVTDRGYGHDIHRDQARARNTVPAIARRGTSNDTGLDTYRWVIERSCKASNVCQSDANAALTSVKHPSSSPAA